MSSPLANFDRQPGQRADSQVTQLDLAAQRQMTQAEALGQPSDMDSDEGYSPPLWDNDGSEG